MSELELWGGIESTICRLYDKYDSQLERSGHINRISDLELFSKTGIKKIRYPVLWEMCDDNLDWAEPRLNKLRELGIEPIVTLLHHGSGPKYTNLTDDNFPSYLSQYAEKVAKRFPWIKYYTPVNEPLTTGRFSGLYGLWYPHEKDNHIFGRCLINQLKGISFSMDSIRQIQPDACLVQTEDLGKTYSTSELQYQADFENERRWIVFDLLTGNINPESPMIDYLQWIGFTERDFNYFENNPCENLIFAIDHYLTSTRFLDNRLHNYPENMYGGNGKDIYVDTECLRVMKEGIPSIDNLLIEAWDRYKQPLAIGECHVNGNDFERISWFLEFWEGAKKAKEKGVDIRAVTSWAFLGSYNWDKLLVEEGSYEEGAFKVVNDNIIETNLVKVLKALANQEEIEEEFKCYIPWWRQSSRILYPEY